MKVLPLSAAIGAPVELPFDHVVVLVCGAVFCLLIAVDLTVYALRALVRAVYPVAVSAFAAGTVFGLLAAVALGVL
jgi:hypothetical protein